MRFLVDNQSPVALARWLNKTGVECGHVLDVGLAQAADGRTWEYAAERDLTIISKDEDFFHRASRPGAAVPIVWIRLGNCRKQVLIAAIEAVWPRVVARLESGDRIEEVR